MSSKKNRLSLGQPLQKGRRNFLKQSVAALSVPFFVPASVLASPAPSDRVRIGIIGAGGRAGTIAQATKHSSSFQIVSICDCFYPRCEWYAAKHGKDQGWSLYENFLEMIEKEKLDGVMIETTTHARAWVTIQAMQAGVDAYIEKPMSLSVEEGRHMVSAARHYNRVTQIGTQQRSIPINNWASDLVKNGAIGKIKTVLAPNFVGPEKWPELPADELPAGGSNGWWDIWTNQAVLRPYHKRLQFEWNRWGDYDTGGRSFGVTGWGTHSYDQIQRALGTDETGPVEVVLEKSVHRKKSGNRENINPDATHLDRLARRAKSVEGPRAKVRMKYANGTELDLSLDGDWGPGLGAIFVGEEGKIEINRNKIASNPQELLLAEDNPGLITKHDTLDHVENWIDCIKSRERCHADIEYGQRSSTLCFLVNIARQMGRVGEPLHWDPETERFTNCDEANTLLSRQRREGYELPRWT